MARRSARTLFLLQLSLLLLLLLHLGGTMGCALVAVGSPIVPLGSAVTASCTIQSKLCRGLEQEKVRITWMLDNEPIAGQQGQGPGDTEVSNLTLPQFNRTQAKLWCWVEWNGTKQRVGMAEIRAGYPPSKPFNLSCTLNLSDYGLTCQWEPGADSHLPTSVVLKCAGSRAPAVTGCTPQGGRSRCTVPRRLLQLYRHMEIWVSATNTLGTAESEHLCIDPMDVAKLDPPALQSIQSIPFQTDCIALTWEVARSNAHMELQCELRYRTPADTAWALVTNIIGHAGTTQCCGFLFGTQYHFQMRCRRSLAQGYWSEWSLGRNYTTHEKAPTGKLDAWWSTRPAGPGKGLEVQLCWKAPRRQEANGQVLGYHVTLSPRRRGRDPALVCNTTHTHCNFSAPSGTRRVYLSAYNAAGEGAATEVVLLERKGQPLAGLRAVPGGERSLWVHWEPPPVPVATYILEWQRVPSEPGHCSACWQMERDGAATTALIQDGIEPFQRYNISVYPLYRDAIGVPVHAAAYSKQKAPSYAPKLHLKSISKSSAELCWDPLPVEMQNGFITAYTIFWANSTMDMSSATVNPSLSSFVIRELKPSTLYKVHIMASTAAGGTNGTSLTLVTTALDDTEIQFLFLTLGLVFILLILSLICFQKKGRVKQQFWPSVPDPANSSLGKWVPAELQQEPLQVPGVKEPGLATISTVTVLERAAGKPPSAWGKEPGAEPTVPQEDRGTPCRGWAAAEPCRERGGSGEPVQYARVMGSGYKGQQHGRPRLYLRSSSTQPLLLDPSPSPLPYENLWLGCPGDGGCPEELPATFPLLQGLRISGAEELHDCRAA
ncbi:granulocyte colony-stimulating factor receptor [Strigops habroptila]|uniref:Colony stimulating factor 3 receptor n=1 Tax=Strigops habroptila TaxID=2489341 RepID=A0A672UX26_STRHB|nr:granulocyte colony-stimulating factor receptor [Strigops habroptila]XP_030360441.1 granulocyte colony-stimulating factor receptor [Strigops habroptila]